MSQPDNNPRSSELENKGIQVIQVGQAERREIRRPMKHIGIAGVTIPGALLCIETIMNESYKYFGETTLIHPQITYSNLPLNEINPAIHSKDWDVVAEKLLESLELLDRSGVDFALIPSNSPHYAIKKVQELSPIPVMNIVDITVEECKRRGFNMVGVLGVDVTMSDGLYEDALKKVGIKSLTLSPTRQKQLNDLIFKDIIEGSPTSETTSKMLHFIQELKDMGCDAFIAGCTEIPVVITSEEQSPLPFIDTTRLLAKKAFELAADIEDK